jgi:hypothetical protein
MPRGIIEPWDDEMFARAAGLKRAGFSSKVIAERLGVSVGSLRMRMQRGNVKARLDGRGGNYGIGEQFKKGPISLRNMEETFDAMVLMTSPEEQSK